MRKALLVGSITSLQRQSACSGRLLLLQQQLLPAGPWSAAAAWPANTARAYRATIQNQGKANKGKKDKKEQESSGASPVVPQPPETTPEQPQQSGAEGVRGQLGATTLSLKVPQRSEELGAGQVGGYYRLRRALLPEAFPTSFRPLLSARGVPAGERPAPRAGCAGLRAEVAAARLRVPTTQPLLMHREVGHCVWAALAASAASTAAQPQRLLLRGPAGSGKSCLVAALVERARASGWLCMYVPSATALISGGFFVQLPDRESASVAWDTPLAAQHILLGLLTAHGSALGGMRAQLPASEAATAAAATAAGGTGGLTLRRLVEYGLASDSPHVPVDVVLAVLQELATLASAAGDGSTPPVLFAVDDYNALYGQTGYGRHLRSEDERGHATVTRVPLTVEQLRLAAALRLLERPGAELGGAHVVASVSHSIGVSRFTRVPLAPPIPGSSAGAQEVFVPRFSQVEAAHALQHYYDVGLAPSPPTAGLLSRLLLLTNGNGAELRRLAATSSLLAPVGAAPPRLLL